MTEYVNKTIYQRQIQHEDGTSKFLTKGEKYSTDKKIKKVDEGVKVVESKPKSTATKNTNKEQQEEGE